MEFATQNKTRQTRTAHNKHIQAQAGKCRPFKSMVFNFVCFFALFKAIREILPLLSYYRSTSD